MKANPYPKLTVVTPSLNQAEYLEEAITSVLDQNYPTLEYVILDGGSKDGSLDIIRRYQRHLTFWSSGPDGGQAQALSEGFRRTTGEWLAWLNADDFYLPGALREVAQRVSSEADGAGLAFGSGQVFNQETGETRPFWPHPPVFNLSALLYGIDFIMQPTAFFRREAYLQCGGLNTELHYCMDYDLWIRLAKQNPVILLDHAIACEREHSKRKTERGKFERWLEIQRMISFHTGLDLTPGLLDYLAQTLLSAIGTGEAAHLFSGGIRRALEVLIDENLVVSRVFCEESDWFPSRAVAPDTPAGFRDSWEKRVDYFQEVGRLHEAAARCNEDRAKCFVLLKECEQDRQARLQAVQQLEKALLAAETDRAQRLSNLKKVEARLKESEADRGERLRMIEELERHLRESQADRAERLRNVKELERQLLESEADRAERLRNMEELKRQLLESEADRAERLRNMEELERQLLESEADRAERLRIMEELERQLLESEADRAERLAIIERLRELLRAAETGREDCLGRLEQMSGRLEACEAARQAAEQKDRALEGEVEELSRYDYRRLPGVRLFYRAAGRRRAETQGGPR